MHPLAIYRAQRPYVFFVCGLISGIILAQLWTPTLIRYYFILTEIVLTVAAFIILGFISRRRNFYLYDLAGLSFLATLIGLGCLISWKDKPPINSRHFSHYPASYLLGYVAAEPVLHSNYLSVEFNVTAVKEKNIRSVDGKLLLRIDLREQPVSLQYGDELLLENHVQVIKPPFNPYMFDYARYMASRNIWHQMYTSPKEIKETARTDGSTVVRYAFTVREYLLKRLAQRVEDKTAVALLSTLVLGYRATLDQNFVQAFSVTGTIHILSVSGMHVGIVFAFFAMGMKWMEKGRYLSSLRLLLLLALIWAYALITGFSASVFRATFMISFVLIGQKWNQSRHTDNHIAASAFFLLLFYPQNLLAVDFQLSYLAVIGMVWIVPRINARIKSNCKLLRYFLTYLTLSCAAQLLTFPLVLYYFHSFPTYFLLANIAVALPATAIIYGGFILLFIPFTKVTSLLASILEKLINLLNELLTAIAHWPGATFSGVWISWYDCAIIYVVLAMLILAFQFASKRLFYGMLACLFVLSVLTHKRIWDRTTAKQLILFNVDKHLAIAIVYGNRPVLYSDIDSVNDARISYAVMPAIEAKSFVKNLTFIPWPSKSVNKQLNIDGNMIQFMDKLLFIIDGNYSQKTLHNMPYWLFIRNDATCDLNTFVDKGGRKPIVILDASSDTYTRKRYEAETKRLGMELYCLKDNFAYVWDAKKYR